MPATDTLRLDNIEALRVHPRKPLPILRGWNRLEGRPRITDFERSLRAEVRDPLWFLTRQWQFGEFQGEDAASPIDVALGVRSTPLATLRIGGEQTPYDPAVPIETRVEREAVPFDLTLHMQASRYLVRLLGSRGIPDLLPEFVKQWPMTAGSVAGEDSADAGRLQAGGAAFLFDTAALLASIRDGKFSAALPAMTPDVTKQGSLTTCAGDLRDWFDRTYGGPRIEKSAWRADRLGYQFGCETAPGPEATALAAEAYHGGTLDWYAFDAVRPPQAEAGDPIEAKTLSFLPTGIDFAGMPSPRFWEMENGRTEFGHIDANTNDLAKLLLAEFVLQFSNDWCIVPLELEIGSFSRTDGLLVSDVFGGQTWVRAANRGGGATWHNWSMYLLSGDNDDYPGLLLTPALTTTVEAPPLEKVLFIRDEMANMVWAIEQRVASRLGEGVMLGSRDSNDATTFAPAAMTRYVLGTSVPDYWRPFIPVHLPGSVRSIRLQRARLPGPLREPKAEILRSKEDYFIEEEEVPRAGRIVQRSFQRARWHDGKTYLWIGRRSETGRGEGSSGLVFDHVLERGERAAV
jgi:hypothetical protein